MDFLPYYYPTTVVLLDDNEKFLANLEESIPENVVTRMMTSPSRTLEFLANQTEAPIDRVLLSAIDKTRDQREYPNRMLEYNFQCVEEQICHGDRFGHVSVIVVDYEMGEGELDGIEFCRRIKDDRIKRILLTGVAKEDIAVNAFNEGVINKYIPKRSKDLDVRLAQAVSELQQAYFRQNTGLLQELINLSAKQKFLNDDFARMFEQVRRDYHIIEFYYVDKPDGFVMLNSEGDLFRLVIMSMSDLALWAIRIESLDVPKETVARVRSGELIPYFGYTPGELDFEFEDLDDFLYESFKVSDTSHCCYVVINDPPANIDFDPSFCSFRNYIEALRS